VFRLLFIGMHVIADVRIHQVVLVSLKVFKHSMPVLGESLVGREKEVLDLFFEHLKSKSRDLKEVASRALVKFCFSLSLRMARSPNDIYYKDLLESITSRLRLVVQHEENPTFLIACLQAFGAMAQSVRVFNDEKRVHDCIEFLIENSEAHLFEKLDRFEHFDYQKNPQNFKAILFNQKQLIGYFGSLDYLFSETTGLRNQEVRFVQRMTDLTTKYLVHFFPPYRNSLYRNFSSFLNALPVVNYNKLIFKSLFQSMLQSMDRNRRPFEFELFSDYALFFLNAISMKVALDRQTVIVEEFINVFSSSIANPTVRALDCTSFNDACAHKAVRDFFNLSLLFLSMVDQPSFQRVFDSLPSKMMDFFSFVEFKFVENPCNFVCLRVLSALLTLNCVADGLKSKGRTDCLDELLTLAEEHKEKYQQKFILCIYEFCFRANSVSPSEVALRTFQKNVVLFLQTEFFCTHLLVDAIALIEKAIERESNRVEPQEWFAEGVLTQLLAILSQKNLTESPENLDQASSDVYSYMRLIRSTHQASAVFDRVLSLVCSTGKFHPRRTEPSETEVDSVTLESCPYFWLSLSALDVRVRLPIKNMFLLLVDQVMDKKTLRCPREAIRECLFLLSKVRLNLDQSPQTTPDNQFVSAVMAVSRKCLELLSFSLKENDCFSEEVLVINRIGFEMLVKHRHSCHQLSVYLSFVKELYLYDLEALNFNNKEFLQQVGSLMQTVLTDSAPALKELFLDELLDFLILSHKRPNEFFQLFRAILFNLSLELFHEQFDRPETLGRGLSTFFFIIHCLREDLMTNRKVIRRLGQIMTEVALKLKRRVEGCGWPRVPLLEQHFDHFLGEFLEDSGLEEDLGKVQLIAPLLGIGEFRRLLEGHFAKKPFGNSGRGKSELRGVLEAVLQQREQWETRGFSARRVLTLLFALGATGRTGESVHLLSNDGLHKECLRMLFDVDCFKDDCFFKAVATGLVEGLKGTPGRIRAVVDSLVEEGYVIDFKSEIRKSFLGCLKKRLKRLKLFVKLSGCNPELAETAKGTITAFIEESLVARDQSSLETQKSRVLMSFLHSFGQPLPWRLLELDKDQVLFGKVFSYLAKRRQQMAQQRPSDSDDSRVGRPEQPRAIEPELDTLIEFVLRKKCFRQTESLFRRLGESRLFEGVRLQFDLTVFETETEVELLFMADLVDFLGLLTAAGFLLPPQSFERLSAKVMTAFRSGMLSVFSVIRLTCATRGQTPLLSKLLASSIPELRHSLHQTVLDNPTSLNVASPLCLKMTQAIDDLIELVRHNRDLRLLEIIEPVFGMDNGKIDPFFDSRMKTAVFPLEDCSVVLGLIDRVLERVVDEADFVWEDKVWGCLIEKVLDRVSGPVWAAVLTERLGRWLSLIQDFNWETPSSDRVASMLLSMKVMFSVLECAFYKVSRTELTSKVLVKVADSSSLFERPFEVSQALIGLCRDMMDGLDTIATGMGLNSSDTLSGLWQSPDSPKKQLVESFVHRVFNLLVQVALKTQNEASSLVDLVLIDSSAHPSRLRFKNLFFFKQSLNFQVLTNFEFESVELALDEFHNNPDSFANPQSSFSGGVNHCLSLGLPKTDSTPDAPRQNPFELSPIEFPLGDSGLFLLDRIQATNRNSGPSRNPHPDDPLDTSYQRLFKNCKTSPGPVAKDSLTELRNSSVGTFAIEGHNGVAGDSRQRTTVLKLTLEMDLLNSHPSMMCLIQLFQTLKDTLEYSQLCRTMVELLQHSDCTLETQVHLLRLTLTFKEVFRTRPVS
jgi:hypothetical protein